MPTTPTEFIVVRTQDPLPLYGDRYERFNRAGIDGERFHYIGKRGGTAQVRATLSTDTYENADTLRVALAAAIGKEIYLIEELDDNRRSRFFLNDATAGKIRAVVSTKTDDNCRVDVTLTLTAVE